MPPFAAYDGAEVGLYKGILRSRGRRESWMVGTGAYQTLQRVHVSR